MKRWVTLESVKVKKFGLKNENKKQLIKRVNELQNLMKFSIFFFIYCEEEKW